MLSSDETFGGFAQPVLTLVIREASSMVRARLSSVSFFFFSSSSLLETTRHDRQISLARPFDLNSNTIRVFANFSINLFKHAHDAPITLLRNTILKGMTLESTQHTHKTKEEKIAEMSTFQYFLLTQMP